MEEGLRSCLFFSQRKWSLGMETYYMSNQLSPPLIPSTAARKMGNVMISSEFCVERKVSSKISFYAAYLTLYTLSIQLIWGY